MVYLNILIIVILVVLSGLFSGLTLGLMSLKPHEIKRKMRLGSKEAQRIYPIRKNGNLLLCTLLLGNVLVNAVLSIFLGSLTAGVVAAVVATGLIVIFGEILPQALFSRYAMRFGAKTAWLTETFIFLLYPFTFPLAFTLDRLLGKELPAAYSKRELGYILEEQAKTEGSGLDEDEYRIMRGSLRFADRKVKQVMTPRKKTLFLSVDAKLGPNLVRKIQQRGYSRMPVYRKDRDTIVGMLYTKDLITLDPQDKTLVKDVMRKHVAFISENMLLDDVLMRFQKKRSHLFVVRGKKRRVAGIVTLEDVLEEIVGEIEDEHD